MSWRSMSSSMRPSRSEPSPSAGAGPQRSQGWSISAVTLGPAGPWANATSARENTAEPIPDGPTIRLMQDLARKHGMVMVVPIYEVEQTGIYYNTAAVIDETGKSEEGILHKPITGRLWGRKDFLLDSIGEVNSMQQAADQACDGRT
jgi:hypothetical protein